MNLIDLINRQVDPVPWSEGEKIPWNDPDFSQRMLLEHLTQEHDAASRRFKTIEKHVEWIHATLLASRPTKILDLGCGPGFYSHRLTRLGHECVGIDFSPASITYAIENAQAEHIKCTYLHQDIRTADYGRDYGLAMLIFGEFNTFRPVDARVILEKAYLALAQNAYLLLEVHTYNIVFEIGREPLSWYSSAHGLFSDHPHICLTENVWNAEQNVATTRFYVVDGASAGVSRYAQSLQAYTNVQYQTLLEECGFRNVVFHPSLTGSLEEVSTGLMVIVCQKPEAG